MIADSWLEMEMFRLFVLRTAWRIDKYQDYKKVRKDISGVKVHAGVSKYLPGVAPLIVMSREMPFTKEVMESFHMGLADGPTEVHKVQVAAECQMTRSLRRPVSERSFA